MRKLTEVEEAKALMTEAVEWSVMRWLREKKRVRKVADTANDALDALEQQIKRSWSAELTAAYGELATSKQPRGRNDNDSISAETRLAARQVKQADDQAYLAHMDAEETFDEAEKQLSTRLAREGAAKAIASWELHESAIRKAEGALQKSEGSKRS
jgi:ribose 1,5-bisphosphokinase PhnN